MMKFVRRRLGSLSRAPDHRGDVHSAASATAVARQCQQCGSARLVRERHSFTAIYRIDAERSISRRFRKTQIFCKECSFLVDDDIHNDAALVYAQLAEQVGFPVPQVHVATQVAEATRAAALLPALSDTERQQDYDAVAEVWGCAGMRTIAENELSDALTRIIRGYCAEGAYDVEIETLEQGILMLSFYTGTGWRPVRIARGLDNRFLTYGQIQLYRFLDAS
ncbi:hypothetical protein [Nocardia blacklockiae]|uniref:hypothetical protein n=1 Tax=Nocardia blacklockiae TaxID=480036 RepID=UPI001893D72F|nr:hypothetical protein [Nocardia blacklockiae]MBF6175156.1 hypothetical protein [Nocardia blacklockiae]